MHVLIADDDRIAAAVLSRTLQQWQYDVTVVLDGAEAWSRLQAAQSEGTPTLAILDWMMPHLEGADVCRRVRQEMPLANMYLMLLTTLESRSDVVAGLDAGADDYLVKPFDPDELRARVSVGVRVLALQERLADRVDELQDALANVKQLHGLLPICSYCKRIRGDDQYWTQVESYIAARSDAQFSHGICPPCARKLDQEIDEYQRRKRAEESGKG
jgi:sigma-B regulation protein RsbU (phosphoserine phosphatase)